MKTLVVAPHPDDELLGCGGLLLKRGEQGAEIGWLIITAISETNGWPKDAEATRNREIETVRAGLAIASENVFQLGFAPAGLDDVRRSDLVSRIAKVVGQFKPTEVLLPFPGDTHSDHLHAFEAAQACVKSFRSPSVRRVLCYETLSETNFGIPIQNAFRPNLFVDITPHLDSKVELLNLRVRDRGCALSKKSKRHKGARFVAWKSGWRRSRRGL